MTTFTDEQFKGYEFRCSTASGNVGFKHICEVYKNNEPIDQCLSVVNWGNRTWEAYQYATVLADSKTKLQSLLDGNTEEEIEIDYDFLNRLANEDYIYTYGEMENGETVIIMDSWSQVEGRSEYNEETNKWEVIEKSVYAKLRDLAEKKLLKPSVQSTIENVEFVFSDSYAKCDECGTIHSTEYGDLTWVEELDMYLCDSCINNADNVNSLVQSAKEDMHKALKPTVNEDIIRELGYELVTEDEFSFAKETWGDTRWGCLNVTQDWVINFMENYDGFVQIACVEQFDCPFHIWVNANYIEEAKKELAETFEREAI